MEMSGVILKLPSVDVVVSLHTDRDPTAEGWAAYLQRLKELKGAGKGDISRVRNFIVSDGGAPSPAQRAVVIREFSERPTPVSVVTNSLTNPVKRGIVTVISWMNPSFRAFSSVGWKDALVHTDTVEAEDTLWDALVELQKDLRSNRTLAEIADRSGRRRPTTFGPPKLRSA